MSLKDAYIIGSENHTSWSQGFEPEAYLKVLPQHDKKLVYTSPWLEWQQGNKNYRDGIYSEEGPNGRYYSSWGPDSDVLDIELRLSDLDELAIPGLGVLRGSTIENESGYDDGFQAYNGMIPGPLLVVDPGDTLKIRLVNDLENRSGLELAAETNFHTHGLHVSPQGAGDNVLFSLSPGEAWETEIKIPDNHFVGPQWYHPHLHGATNLQVSNGLAGTLLVLASEEEANDLDKFSPVDNSFYWMAVQTQSLLQQERPASSNDPLNQDPNSLSYRIGTPPVFTDVDGTKVFTKSDAAYIGYNFKPDYYDPTQPTGDPTGTPFAYGAGIAGTPTENVIHTVNGQYNPTIDVETGQWNVFGFLNQSVNSHFVIQLVREYKGELSLEEFQVIAVDGDAAGVVSQALQFVTETPVMAPGNRMTVQQAFTKPGKYYFLANGTEEILGDLAPQVANITPLNLNETPGLDFNPDFVANDVQGALYAGAETWNELRREVFEGPLDLSGMHFPPTWDLQGYDLTNVDLDGSFMGLVDLTGVDLRGSSLKNVNLIGANLTNTNLKEVDLTGSLLPGSVVHATNAEYDQGTYPYQGIHDGHLIWGAQVLATVEVTGESLSSRPSPPEPIQYLLEESEKIDTWVSDTKSAIANDSIKRRNFIWDANYGRIQEDNRIIDDNDPSTFENMYWINGRWFGHSPGEQTAIVMPMLGTTEEWTVQNSSIGYGAGAVGEWHPFHIHQNDFVVTEINGINVEDIPAYPANQLVDTVTLASSYVAGSATTNNPYGTPAYYNPITESVNGIPQNFEAKFFMKFEDYTGAYVNHCHILFHEDAGMMQAVKVILNTDSNYIGAEKQSGKPTFRIGSSMMDTFTIDNGDNLGKKVNIAIGDINYGKYFGNKKLSDTFEGGTKGESDNIADIAIADKKVDKKGSGFQVNVYDGDSVNQTVTGSYKLKIDQEKQSEKELSGSDHLLTTIQAFKKKKSRSITSSLAVGDLNGDGHGDIIIGIGGANTHPMIEIYSGADYERMAKIKPFWRYGMNTTINLAAGDINSDNFVDILVGQGSGGMGMVEVFDGRALTAVIKNDQGNLIDDEKTAGIKPFKGKKVAQATEAYDTMFHPFPGYTGEVDVASGYILPRPSYSADETLSEDQGQIVQTSYANFTTLAVDMKSSTENPSIRSFFYTGGSVHANHSDTEQSSADHSEGSLPSLAVSLNIDEKITGINNAFFDLSDALDDRGMNGLVITTKKGEEFLHYIEPSTVEQGEFSIMDTVAINITPS